ncbi:MULTISPECIES: ABC transporter ATP-binding protein [Chryseobacterium]|uniref:Iron complex transport system ATP-binding protein n=1 Tax=Chryseobacterium camelliae TaxID=1265445 RepID=A0ABU0TGE7_9FLAO|nr:MULTISPECIES: ABC transporter ATP-binding protein [Chryseobacterium]MDT3406070.1 iron complex transport system ATP-binding protein [Pseudacidovorax intermedius]MDQ1096130.1 iron complex transport system ATP-binding protein [Chryseobacterium camelliae]MDQ1100066.1 iron complex transport system ATP-binding protein [Chryseobacterium sp. SORGH_AS_1048]MDR6087410.1 iron complex transport system ATP-binding protein [Chryseobacterium sp. SORGH_AS_0909]MDR6131784.1 iron complex transport system ATP
MDQKIADTNHTMQLKISQADIGYKNTLISEANAQLQSGEVCLLIGNNGVGKTTLIRSILHQIPLLRGTLTIGDKNIQQLSVKEIAEHIAVVFSKSVIPQNYTVNDLVSLGKYIHYPFYFELTEKDKKEVRETIEDLGLQQYHNTLLKNLSDGNLQKALIGRALIQNSPVIILDEPTTHLDEQNKIIILKTLRKLAREHRKLILFSSHDWRLAKEFADKIWYIKDRMLHAGIVEDVLIQHHELTDPSLFHVNEYFKPPRIIAPPLQKEMLYSLLQKNSTADLSLLSFEFTDYRWKISINESNYQYESFEEILSFIKKLH